MSNVKPPRTPVGRVAYPQVVTPKKRNENSDPRFSVTLVWPASVDLTEMKKVVKAACLEKYPNGIPGGFRSPFRKGEERRRDDGTLPAGFKDDDVFAEFWRYSKHGDPVLVDQYRNELPAADLYAGCEALVVYRPFCYSVDGNKGVSLSFEGLQFVRAGEPIGAAPLNAEAAFDVLEEAPAETELPF